jgi:hypothetical protein
MIIYPKGWDYKDVLCFIIEDVSFSNKQLTALSEKIPFLPLNYLVPVVKPIDYTCARLFLNSPAFH